MGLTEKEMKWDKLDNTALLFPVIASESRSSVYRISATLTQEIQPDKLQEALEWTLPQFDIFHARIRRGMFWYYFETNTRPAPAVREEIYYPCRYIEDHQNNGYMFRVTYHKTRINLEVFHVLTDGMGAFTFLRELVYQYLRLTNEDLMQKMGEKLCSDTSLNKEDSYLKNYPGNIPHKKYKTQRAVELSGEFLPKGALSVMHGYMDADQVKKVAKSKNVSVNTFLVGVYTYSIYKEHLHKQPSEKPVSICVPVNLRPYYESITMKNFFAMTAAVFEAKEKEYSLDDVIHIVDESLKSQLTKEHMDQLISYNVSNQKNMVLRMVPLFIKNIAMKWVYHGSALANTSTVTNLGRIAVKQEYEPYILNFTATLSMTKGQNMKATVCTYQNQLIFTISSKLTDHSIQKCFFQTLAKEGLSVTVETNEEA